MRRINLTFFGVFFSFFILINIFFKDPVFQDQQKALDIALKTKQYALAEETYQHLLEKYPENLNYHYGYILNHFQRPDLIEEKDHRSIWLFYQQKTHSTNPFVKDLGFFGMGLMQALQNKVPDAFTSFEKIQDQKLKYLNFSLGEIYVKKKQDIDAESSFLKEIYNQGDTTRACSSLLQLYVNSGQIHKADTMLHLYPKHYFFSKDLQEYAYAKGKLFQLIKSISLEKMQQIGLKNAILFLLMIFFWLFFIKRLDVFEPEKWAYILFVFFMGFFISYGVQMGKEIIALASVPAFNGNFLHDLLQSVLRIGLVDELAKLIPFFLLLYGSKQVDMPIDYILYPMVSALGFGICENLSVLSGTGIDIVQGKMLSSLVIQMVCSSFIGYGMYFDLGNKNRSKSIRFFMFLCIAVCVHGVYAFCELGNYGVFFTLAAIFILIGGVLVWNTCINNALNFSVDQDNRIKNLNFRKIQPYLVCGLWGMLFFEYLYVVIGYGPYIADIKLIQSFVSGSYLIFFLANVLSVFLIKRNYKAKLFSFRFRSAYYDGAVGETVEIRMLKPDPYEVFPQCGEVLSRETIFVDNNWYMVKLENPITQLNICGEYIMVQPKAVGMGIDSKGMTMAGIYFIKDYSVFYKKKKTKKDLLFLGWGGIAIKNQNQ